MGLIICEDCGREVSTRLSACPHCGGPIEVSTEEAPVEQGPVANVTPANQMPPAIPAAWSQQTVTEAGPVSKARKSPLASVGVWWLVGIVVFLFMVRSCIRVEAPPPHAMNPVVTKPAVQATESPESIAEKVQKLEFEATNLDGSRQVRLTAANELISKYPNTPASKTAKEVVDEIYAEIANERIGNQWRYFSNEEGMSGKPTRFASVESTNTVNFGFPYSGEQRATLLLRRHPRWGNDVIFQIEKGQILCRTYGDCTVGIRFDDGQIIRLNGNPPADNSSESFFIPAFGTFIKKLPEAKIVRIEVRIYQNGAPVFEFDVSGFKPEKFK